ncbi:MAG: HAD-IA family hydrolase [Acidobacteriota bacterium]
MKLSRRHSLKALGAAAVAGPASAAGVPTPAIRLVALDVGGTILQDHGDVVQSLQNAMARRDIVVSAADIGPWRGAAKRAVIRHFVDLQSKLNEAGRQTLAAEIYKTFVQQVNQAYQTVPPIEGAEETIRKLRESGYLLATTTGFDREIVVPIFHRFGWEKYFAAMVASDDVAQGRPAPYMLFHAMETAGVTSVAEVMAVGDTALDLQAASNAGVRGIVGVLSGAGTAEQLRREPHTEIIKSVVNLPALLGPKG